MVGNLDENSAPSLTSEAIKINPSARVTRSKKRATFILSLAAFIALAVIMLMTVTVTYQMTPWTDQISPKTAPLVLLSTAPWENIIFGINVTHGIPKFSADFYTTAKTAGGGKSRNWVFSPFSLCAAFAMLKVGMRGAMLRQIAKTLYFPPNDDKDPGIDLASGFFTILRALHGNNQSTGFPTLSDFTRTPVNRMFIDPEFQYSSSYPKIIQELPGSWIERLVLNPAASKLINRWVTNVAGNKIRDLVSPGDFDLTGQSKFVLVNVIYFEFEKKKTRNKKFYFGDHADESILVEMTHQTLRTRVTYLPEIDADLFLLPHEGGRLSMVIYLPRTRRGLSIIEGNLTSIPSLSQIVPQLRPSFRQIIFPKLKIVTTIDVLQILRRLGVTLTSSETADSIKIKGNNNNSEMTLKVTQALQKAVIIVDYGKIPEVNGPPGARSKRKAIRGGHPILIIVQEYDLIVNRPFYFQVVDSQNTDVILMAGSVTHPKLAKTKT